MAKNFTDLSPAEVEQTIRAAFAARGRVVKSVSFGIVNDYDARNQPCGYKLDSVRVEWDEAGPSEPNPRTA